MACDRCGSRTPRSRLCAECARHERFGEIAQNQADGQDEDDQDATPVECTVCGAAYDHVDQPCPACGSRRRRYAGDDEWEVEQTGLDGGTMTGQSTLAGGVAKDGGER